MLQFEEKLPTVLASLTVSPLNFIRSKPVAQVELSTSATTFGNKAGGLLDDLVKLSDNIKLLDLPAKLKSIGQSMETVTSKIMEGASTMEGVFSGVEMVFETILSINSLVGIVSNPITPMSIVSGLYVVYKLIKTYILKLPPLIRSFLVKDDVFHDAPDMVAEGGGSLPLLNLCYSALIMVLPNGVRQLLDTFQKYTRVKILEDLDWMYHVAEIILSIPSYIITMVSEGFKSINASWAKGVVAALEKGHTDYERLVSFIPELATHRLSNEMNSVLTASREDRRIISDPAYVAKLQRVYNEAVAHQDKLRVVRNYVSASFSTLVTECGNLYRSCVYMIQQSHPEPVAVLLYSEPGEGKTVFIQRCRKYLSANGRNTIYDYTPTDSRSDFHDQYHDQNVWIHEDIGQRGEQDWAQYIMHIGSNPSRMDGAALDKKSTIFFRSQVILGTTNIPIHHGNMTPVKDCGWKDVRAINRRFMVVCYQRNSDECRTWTYNTEQRQWRRGAPMNCASPAAFCETLRKMYASNVKKHQDLVKNDDCGEADFCFGDIAAEGRMLNVVLDVKPVDEVIELPDLDHPRVQIVTIDGQEIVHDSSVKQQEVWLKQGKLINGGSETVGIGDVCITDDYNGWMEYLSSRAQHYFSELTKTMCSYWDNLKVLLGVLNDQVPREYKVVMGIFSGLSTLAVAGVAWFNSMRKAEKETDYQPFVGWARGNKRTKAADLYAEGVPHPNLNVEMEAPTPALAAIQRNVLRSTFTYHNVTSTGYVVMVDADTLVTTAHILLEREDPPKEVFIRGFGSDGGEKLASFFIPIRWNLEEDLVVMKYKNPHQHVFRALKKSMTKVPSNRELYLVMSQGFLPLGTPERCEVTSGIYRSRWHTFKLDEMMVHSYDGLAQSAPGLCGALVATKDGYIVGWHVAGNQRGKGYVRFWNNAIKEVVLGGVESDVVPLKDTEVTGAMVIDTNEYHHVSFASGIVPSSMLEHMITEPDLCPDGRILRAPAELGGKDDGVRTYDRSRLKNLKSVETPVQLGALEFARAVVTDLIRTVLPTKKIKKLTDQELVVGLSNEDGVIRKVNLEASAGVPLGGLVSDWVNVEAKTVDPKVLQLMQEIEARAKKRQKHYDDIMFKDCDKDEMRDVEKVKKPRCFAAGPLQGTLLLRRWFGRLNALFMKFRHQTGIMIGINATSKEWGQLWRRLCLHPNHFDGDYEMWDGAMRREFQEKLNDVLSDFCEDKDIGLTLLMHLCETTRVGMDFSYITTHSVPSGHGLTALYNSLINKMYMAYAWYLLTGPKLSLDSNIQQFYADIYCPVYGDDVVASVSDRIKHKFNAMTYGAVMRDLGIGFTSASKGIHEKPFVPLREITFLKRHFYANRKFMDIVGPLNLKVLRGSAGFVHDISRDRDITSQKMDSLQRELFLHSGEVYLTVWSALRRCFFKAFGVEYYGLTEEKMLAMYDKGELRSDLFEAYAEGVTMPVFPSKRAHRNLCQW